MKAQFDGCRLMMDGERRWWLQLRLLPDFLHPARMLCDALANGGVWDVSAKKSHPRRSLDANAYFWSLLDKLAAKKVVDGTDKKNELYRQLVQDVGGNSDIVCIPTPGVARLRREWEAKGLGWPTDAFESKLPGCTNVRLYYGSSTYDTAQMSRLIDLCVDECRAQGIDTATPSELALLKGGWGK